MLEARRLRVHYDGIVAVKGIDFTMAAGETVALIGANGAGKSSALNALACMLPATCVEGHVCLDGQSITSLPGHRLIEQGLALVPEGRGVFARLTVAENLALGAYHRRDKAGIARDLARIHDLMPRLYERRLQTAGTLSGGEQQILALGRALMGRPRLLLLDEPSMGLAPLMVRMVFDVIRTIAAEGVGILLVEQNAALALETASRGYVMESGAIVLAAPASELIADARVRQAYLGG